MRGDPSGGCGSRDVYALRQADQHHLEQLLGDHLGELEPKHRRQAVAEVVLGERPPDHRQRPVHGDDLVEDLAAPTACFEHPDGGVELPLYRSQPMPE